MKSVEALVLKIGAFLVLCFSFWKWGQISGGKKKAKKDAEQAIKTSQEFEEINSEPFVDDPCDWLSYDESEHTPLPEDDKESS